MSDVVALFTELAALPSPSGEERAVADAVKTYLGDLGLDVSEDAAGSEIGSTIGNLHCRIEPTEGESGLPIFLCAHLDTVPPSGPIEPTLDGGIVRNAHGTILGADDKSAVAAMLEATRALLAETRPHAGLELVFTPKEEVGLVGARAFDHERLAARVGYVYDHAGPVGEIILGAPYNRGIEARFRGRAAHAGMVPEEGRSAIFAAAKAIADLRLGRLDAETTANVGTIQGGSARNVVPECCSFIAEARSHDEQKLVSLVQEMVDTIAFAAALADCEVETVITEGSRGYLFKRDDLPVRLAATALGQTGYSPSYARSGGGADANVFNERGLQCVNLANGMTNIHTPEESISADDLEGMVAVTLALLESARSAA